MKDGNHAPLHSTIGDASAWRADMRAGNVPRRPPPTSPEPDRKHVDRRPVVMTTADKPPQNVPAITLSRSVPLSEGTGTTPASAPDAPAPDRKFFNPEFRAEIVADFYASRRAEPHLTQLMYSQRIGIEQTTLSRWIEKERQEVSDRRRRKRQEQTAARVRSEPARSFESVSRELAEAVDEVDRAKQRVRALKAELRGLLDDEGE